MIVHIELQVKVDADIGERLAEYGLRLYRREHIPVRSMAVFLKPAKTLPQSPFGWDIMGEARERYVFDVIRFWELPPEQVLGIANYDLWPLSALMAGSSVTNVVRVAERIAEVPLPRQERVELTGALVLLAGLRIPQRLLANALRRTPMLKDILSESQFPELIHEIYGEEWEQEAHAKGLAEGRAEGLAEGLVLARDSARLALEARFGSLDDSLIEAIGHADAATLRAVLTIAATEPLEQIRTRLGLK